ncbi:hypothetical protein B7P43_G16960 [Cryptotermes secundus]|uniref:Fatty acyl-CoA reductase n=1 Tax=Cryptotermes secundus TaxID=105785 RepID=A0A2J7REK1_9NEOP|nr:hypothetical protein B7P43_G16960 [Cryptotermes secundus]
MKEMVTTLQEFYQGKVVLLTGATGFLGKMLLVKLLLSCPDIEGIIVLLRKNKEETVTGRLSATLSSSVFSEVPEEKLLKVSAVEADIEEPGLGLSSEDRELILKSHVSIVFHVAASVKFNKPLHVAIKANTLSVLGVLQLCHELPEIKALVYVSTAYSQCPHSEIEEKIYPMDLKLSAEGEILDGENGTKYRDVEKWPNTYTYSKALAEDMIQKNKKHLPVAIFRPSMVINAWKEPHPGWINNVYGVTRILADLYLGRTQICLYHDRKVCDLIPVDMCANAMIAIGWETAMAVYREQTKVYNFVSGTQNPITWKEYWLYVGQKIKQCPAAHAQWYYCLICTRFWPIYSILWCFLQLVPAFLLQILFYCTSPPKRHIRHSIEHLKYVVLVKYFSLREWKYHDTNVRSLLGKLTPEDRDIFNFDIKQLNWNEYIESCVKGVRQHILKDDMSTLAFARKRYQTLYALHCVLVTCLILLIFRMVWYFCS